MSAPHRDNKLEEQQYMKMATTGSENQPEGELVSIQTSRDELSDSDSDDCMPGLVPATMASTNNLIIRGGYIIPGPAVSSRVTVSPTALTASGLRHAPVLAPSHNSGTLSTGGNMLRTISPASCSYPCPICCQLFGTLSDRNTHMNIHLGQNLYRCMKCGFSSANVSAVETHAAIHFELNLYQCGVCRDVFGSEVDRDIHWKTTHMTDQLSKKHTSTHSEKKSDQCNFCSKTFATMEEINAHMSSHTRGKLFSCNQCEFVSNQESALQEHIKTHSEDRAHLNEVKRVTSSSGNNTGIIDTDTASQRSETVQGQTGLLRRLLSGQQVEAVALKIKDTENGTHKVDTGGCNTELQPHIKTRPLDLNEAGMIRTSSANTNGAERDTGSERKEKAVLSTEQQITNAAVTTNDNEHSSNKMDIDSNSSMNVVDDSPIQLDVCKEETSEEGPHICVVCGEEFKTWEAVILHLQTHNVVEPHKCSEYNVRFDTDYELHEYSITDNNNCQHENNPLLSQTDLTIQETSQSQEKSTLEQDLNPSIVSDTGEKSSENSGEHKLNLHKQRKSARESKRVESIRKSKRVESAQERKRLESAQERKRVESAQERKRLESAQERKWVESVQERKRVESAQERKRVESARKWKRAEFEQKVKRIHNCCECGKGFPYPSRLKKHMTRHDRVTRHEDNPSWALATESEPTIRAHDISHIHLANQSDLFVDVDGLPDNPSDARSVLVNATTNNTDMSRHNPPGASAEHSEGTESFVDVEAVSDTSSLHEYNPLPAPDDLLNQRLVCPYCEADFVGQADLVDHVKMHAGSCGGLVACGVCVSGFLSTADLENHLTTHGHNTHTCSVCGERFSRADQLLHHMMVHTAEGPHRDPLCESAVIIKQDSLQHVLTHARCRKCPVCSRWCTDVKSLREHTTETHTGGKPHQCSVCSRRYTWSLNLKKHMRTHRGEKYHQCPVCSKRYTLATYLQKHILTQSTYEKDHKCSLCSQVFSSLGSIRRHMLIHTGQKSHQCSVCSRSFTLATYLRKHMVTHTGEKPYQCSVCSRRFALSDGLGQHMKIHIAEKPHQCSVCGMSYIRSQQLLRHMKIHSDKGMMSHTRAKPGPNPIHSRR